MYKCCGEQKGKVMNVIERFHYWLLKRRAQQAATRAARLGTGGTMSTWPVDMPIDEIVSGSRQWLRESLSNVRTPYGIDTCSIAVRIVRRADGRWQKRWATILPSFRRGDPQAMFALLEETLRHLPWADYPDATHIDLDMASAGDIFASAYK